MTESLRSVTKQDESQNEMEQTELVEPFLEFDAPVDVTCSYQQYSSFPPAPSRPTNLIEPVRRFVSLERIDTKGPEFELLAKEVISFGAACLNECTNGVIYFGVKELKKVGVVVQCDKLLLDKSLTQQIKKCFHDTHTDRVLQCIRPIRWVPVRCRGASSERYIFQIDVKPASDLCGDMVFLVNKSKNLFRFGEDGPCAVREDRYFSIFKEQEKLALCRKKEEDKSRRRTRKPPSAHRDKLISVLCRGKSKFRQGNCPILVLPPADDDLKASVIEEKFSFLPYIKWKAVLDFGSDRKFLDYMKKQDRLFKIRDVIEFDSDFEDPAAVKNTKEDAYNGHVPNWVLVNGDMNMNCKPRGLTGWKRDVEDAFRGCSKIYTKGSRVLVVFLLHSSSSDVYIDACAQLCLQTENYACISESEALGKTWQAGVMKREYVDSVQLSKKIVAGLNWEFVSDIVKEITSDEPQTACMVPTLIGDQVLTIKRELCDLHVLGSNECENIKFTDEFLQTKEVEFYKGGKVDWPNFYSDGVCTRDIFSPLCNKVRAALNEDGVEGEITEGINTIHLYHQPGSGGTTCARHVLWHFHKELKCAEIAHFTENTCAQIAKLRDFGEQTSDDPGPLLLLIDNIDPDKLLELLVKLRKQAQKRDRNVSKTNVYCVCLIVDSTSNLPKEKADKDDPYECLSQKLSDQEVRLFERQSQRLQEKKHACHTLIAFNIMKENFNQSFITSTVGSLVKGITKSKELFLLKYLAFLNLYDVCQRDVECLAFTDLMVEDPDWVHDFSDALNVLVTQETGDNGHLCFKISHPLLSEEILKVLRKGTLSQFTKDFLNNRYLKSRGSQAIVNLQRLLAGIMKQREINERGYRASFSKLILEICNEDWHEAATILLMVYRLTDDVFVGQQLARLHIEHKSWEGAIEYASEVASKVPDNYHLLDTKGQVYRTKLETHYKSFSELQHCAPLTVVKALHFVKEALEATNIFKEAQKLSYEMNSKNPTAKPTISGQLGSLQIYASLLENLTLLSVFAPEYPGQPPKTMQRFLKEAEYIPPEIETWGDDESYDYINFLKSIPEDAKETLRYVEDFHTHVNQGFERLKDTDYDLEIARQKSTVRGLKRRLFKFIFEANAISTDLSVMRRKDDIWLMGGTSFSNIMEQLQQRKQEWLVSKESISYLNMLLDHADECLKVDSNHYEAIECFLSATLVVSCYFEQTSLITRISYQDVLHWSKRLYAIRNSKHNRLEPYMYYVMFHWPKTHNDEDQKAISDAMTNWRELYLQKNPNMMAKQAFYFSKGTGLKSFVHRSQLYNAKKHRGDNFFKDEDVRQVLKRFTGTLDEKGKSVYLQDEKTKETILNIPTSHLINDDTLWRNTVSFAIAFSFVGPKAYDVQRE